jgi:hypothetical protein
MASRRLARKMQISRGMEGFFGECEEKSIGIWGCDAGLSIARSLEISNLKFEISEEIKKRQEKKMQIPHPKGGFGMTAFGMARVRNKNSWEWPGSE